MIQKASAGGQLVTGSFFTSAHLLMHPLLCRVFDKTSNHPGDSALLQPRFGALWLFPKLKLPLKGKRFQTVDEIQDNRVGQLIVIG